MQKHCKRLKEFDQRDERKTQMLLLKLKINEPLLRHLNRTTHQIQLMNDIIIIIMVKKKKKHDELMNSVSTFTITAALKQESMKWSLIHLRRQTIRSNRHTHSS